VNRIARAGIAAAHAISYMFARMLKRFINSPYTLWLLLALPAFLMLKDAFTYRAGYSALLYESGEWSARLMIVAMAVTPLRMLFKGWQFPSWLMKRRRYLGVAAFGYGLLHFVFFLMREGDLAYIFADIGQTWMWTGWIAFLVLVPLALTSNNWSVRALGWRWKRLQQLVYLAAVLAFGHWVLHRYNFGPALMWFMPLTLLELYRIRLSFLRSRAVLQPS
jgi:sulfoxide reductase heme-binding subunit YedZ